MFHSLNIIMAYSNIGIGPVRMIWVIQNKFKNIEN